MVIEEALGREEDIEDESSPFTNKFSYLEADNSTPKQN